MRELALLADGKTFDELSSLAASWCRSTPVGPPGAGRRQGPDHGSPSPKHTLLIEDASGHRLRVVGADRGKGFSGASESRRPGGPGCSQEPGRRVEQLAKSPHRGAGLCGLGPIALSSCQEEAVGPGVSEGSYLVDPASSHMLVSKIKPCMSKYKLLYCETANGSLNQL